MRSSRIVRIRRNDHRADIKLRYDRTQNRGDGDKDRVTFEQFIESSNREDEGKGTTSANIRAVIASADAIVTNDGTLEELHKQVDDVLPKIEQ
jgi:dephospho-CoA kinase